MLLEASQYQEFAVLLDSQQFEPATLDYRILDKHISQLQVLGEMGNSSILVVDLSKKNYVYSSGLYDAFVRSIGQSEILSQSLLDQRVHPEDAAALVRLWTVSLKFCYALSPAERKQHKIIMDYRIRTPKGDYLRIIEQHQVLEMDARGNIWLTLSFVDISPDQELEQGLRYTIINCKTGEVIGLPADNKSAAGSTIKLSAREKQILTLIKEGFISKEIAEKLFLSIHTVNTHRQRILEKLNADSSIDAIRYASSLNLLG
jgi:DNA-binding CsgD family transcriptional regulator